MSIFSHCTVTASTSDETASAGRSLAHSLYRENLTILLTGELGAGKTTLAQGFASGLGVKGRVQSPSFALEQRYTSFTHIDLYRLTPPQSQEFLSHSEDAAGIRLIEWAERIDRSAIGPHIHVHIEDRSGLRIIHCDFLDEPVPDDTEIDRWIDEVRLPANVRRHLLKVTAVADILGASLSRSSHRLLRTEALHAAARTHDLLRFVDFKTWNGDMNCTPTESEKKTWALLKERYGTPHEEAAAQLLSDHGYASIGEIVRTHRGMESDGTVSAKTTEQQLLAYSDKRVPLDRIATLDERFDELIERHHQGKEPAYHRAWRTAMKQMEKELFPDGVPALELQ